MGMHVPHKGTLCQPVTIWGMPQTNDMSAEQDYMYGGTVHEG